MSELNEILYSASLEGLIFTVLIIIGILIWMWLPSKPNKEVVTCVAISILWFDTEWELRQKLYGVNGISRSIIIKYAGETKFIPFKLPIGLSFPLPIKKYCVIYESR